MQFHYFRLIRRQAGALVCAWHEAMKQDKEQQLEEERQLEEQQLIYYITYRMYSLEGGMELELETGEDKMEDVVDGTE
jgi:hypothetical protein